MVVFTMLLHWLQLPYPLVEDRDNGDKVIGY